MAIRGVADLIEKEGEDELDEKDGLARVNPLHSPVRFLGDSFSTEPPLTKLLLLILLLITLSRCHSLPLPSSIEFLHSDGGAWVQPCPSEAPRASLRSAKLVAARLDGFTAPGSWEADMCLCAVETISLSSSRLLRIDFRCVIPRLSESSCRRNPKSETTYSDTSRWRQRTLQPTPATSIARIEQETSLLTSDLRPPVSSGSWRHDCPLHSNTASGCLG